jgi:alkyl hydroperoxide reductase subunit AhpF
MPTLSDQDRKTLETRFKKDLKRDVMLTLYTVRSVGGLVLPGRECQTCAQTEELLTEITDISSHLNLTLKDFYTESEETQEMGIDRIPCITLQAEGDEPSNLRFYGIPAGFEILTLIEDVVAASRGVSPLQLTTRKALRKLEKEVHIQVFVTPG